MSVGALRNCSFASTTFTSSHFALIKLSHMRGCCFPKRDLLQALIATFLSQAGHDGTSGTFLPSSVSLCWFCGSWAWTLSHLWVLSNALERAIHFALCSSCPLRYQGQAVVYDQCKRVPFFLAWSSGLIASTLVGGSSSSAVLAQCDSRLLLVFEVCSSKSFPYSSVL